MTSPWFSRHLENQFVGSDYSADGSCLLWELVTEPAAMVLVTA